MTVGDLQQGDKAVIMSFLCDLDKQSQFLEMDTIYDCIYECFGLPGLFLIYQGGLWLGFS